MKRNYALRYHLVTPLARSLNEQFLGEPLGGARSSGSSFWGPQAQTGILVMGLGALCGFPPEDIEYVDVIRCFHSRLLTLTSATPSVPVHPFPKVRLRPSAALLDQIGPISNRSLSSGFLSCYAASEEPWRLRFSCLVYIMRLHRPASGCVFVAMLIQPRPKHCLP